ncbi:hypothetical protein [Streptomyces tibetensis]|uniref:hypothetical protein n=1 Tax=Streptomyces tibetensis TaxID=2382123 RepID=UPI003F4CCCD3
MRGADETATPKYQGDSELSQRAGPNGVVTGVGVHRGPIPARAGRSTERVFGNLRFRPTRVVAGAHRADLRGGGLAGPPYEIGVPGRTEADRLGENGGLAHPGDAMQGLLAGVEGRDAQALDGGRELMQVSHLFVEGEPRQKVVDALCESQL